MQEIKLQKITYKNWMGIPDLVIMPGSVTIVTGKNGHGKTSIIEGLRYCVRTGKKFHDPSVIGSNGEFAMLTVEFSDGYLLRVKVKPKATERYVADEKGHEVTRSAEHIEAICNALSVDPMAFLALEDDKRLAAVLEATDLRVTAAELSFVPARLLASTQINRHALIVLSELDKAIYDERTGQNRIVKEKDATVKQLTDTLPPDPGEAQDFQALQKEYDAAVNDRAKHEYAESESARLQTAELEMECRTTKGGIISARNLQIETLRKAFDARCAETRANAETEIATSDTIRSANISKIAKSRDSKLALIAAESGPQIKRLTEALATAKAQIETHAAAQKTREFITTQKAEADRAKLASDKLTEAIEKLETLKNKLAADIPIKGMQIKDGQIYIDGVVWKRVNDARKLEIAADYSILKAGAAKFLVADNLERLDPENYPRFLKILESKGMQVIGAKVSGGELVVATGDSYPF